MSPRRNAAKDRRINRAKIREALPMLRDAIRTLQDAGLCDTADALIKVRLRVRYFGRDSLSAKMPRKVEL